MGEVAEGLAILAFSFPDDAAIVVDYIAARNDYEDLIEVGDGLVVLAFYDPCLTPIVVGIGALGIESKGLAKVGNGLVALAFPSPGNATLTVDFRYSCIDIAWDDLAVAVQAAKHVLAVFVRCRRTASRECRGLCLPLLCEATQNEHRGNHEKTLHGTVPFDGVEEMDDHALNSTSHDTPWIYGYLEAAPQSR